MIVYDYYTIYCPVDVSEDPKERLHIAILEAAERARLYAMPCEWTAWPIDNQLVKVVRKRLRRKGGVR